VRDDNIPCFDEVSNKHSQENGIGGDGKTTEVKSRGPQELFTSGEAPTRDFMPDVVRRQYQNPRRHFNKAGNKYTTSSLTCLFPNKISQLSFPHSFTTATAPAMAQFFQQPQQPPYGQSAQNLQFYPSSYTPNPVSGHATPSQASYGYGAPVGSPGYGGGGGFNSGFGGAAAVSGRMGEQGGLRTGWLAAFGTEGYDGEPPLLEELGVNFGHVWSKVFPVLLFAVPLPNLKRSRLIRYM
jgi:hypothetical protein